MLTLNEFIKSNRYEDMAFESITNSEKNEIKGQKHWAKHFQAPISISWQQFISDYYVLGVMHSALGPVL